MRLYLHNDSLVLDKNDFEGHHNFPKVSLVPGRLVDVLGVENVVHGAAKLVLVHDSGSDSSELLHLSSATKKKTWGNVKL
jgi:hypothetical protein